MANIQWTAGATLDYSNQSGGSSSLKYVKGTTYKGMPYNNAQSSYELFKDTVVNGTYSPSSTSWDSAPGNSCAISIRHAWQSIGPAVRFDSSKDLNPVLGTGVLKVGDINWSSYTLANPSTQSVIYAHSDPYVIINAYALVGKGDAFVTFTNGHGHSFMVVSNSPVYSGGQIDYSKSKITVLEQNNYLSTSSDGYSTSWRTLTVDYYYLYEKNHLPVTCQALQDDKAEVTENTVTGASTSTDLVTCYLKGNLTSNYFLKQVTAEVTNAGGKVVASAKDYPASYNATVAAKRYSFADLAPELNLASVPAGDYTLTIKVKAGYNSGVSVVYEMDFTKETDMVVFVKDNVGSGTGDGSSYENALKPTSVVTAGATGVYNQKNTALYQAWKKIINAGVNSATIVICGDYTITDANCYMGSSSWGNADFNYQDGMDGSVSITYTSVFGGKDFRKDGACIRLEGKSQLSFPTETKTESIDFVSSNRTADTTMLCGNHFGLYLGKDTTFNQPTTFTIFGGSRSNSNSSGTTTVTVDIGDENTIGDIYGLNNGGSVHSGDSNIVIKSGTILGIIAGDNGIAEESGLTGNVNITIAGGNIKNNVYGVTGGFSDNNSTVTVKVTGGAFSNWVRVMPTDGELHSGKYAPASSTLNLSGASASVADAVSSKAPGFTTKKNPLVVFIKDGGTGDGTTADKAMGDTKTTANYTNGNVNALKNTALYKAWEKCIAAGGGTIVVCGEHTINDAKCYMESGWTNADMKYLGTLNPDITITYTSVYKNNDYRLAGAKITLTEHSHLMFPTATVTENISFANKQRSADRNISDIGGSGCDLYLGNDTRFIENAANFRIIGGSRSNASDAGSTNVTLNIGNGQYNCVGSVYGLSDGTNAHSGNATVNIISGTVLGNVVGDGYTIGTSGDVEINISGGTVKGMVCGASVGFTDKDSSVRVNISGVNFSECDAVAIADGIASGYNAPAYTELDLNGLDEATRNQVVAIADKNFTFDMPLVIFIKDGGTGDGRTSNAPLATGTGSVAYKNAPLYRAWEEILASGDSEATIVVCGTYTMTEAHTNPTYQAGDKDIILDNGLQNKGITITYTSVYGGVDYRETAGAKLTFQGMACLTFPTATITKDITIQGSQSLVSGRHTWIAGALLP